MGKAKLTNKQLMFINHYLVCYNASEAARRAGYSEASAASIGSENLHKPEIRAAIDARIEAATLTADEALRLLAEQATADMGQFVDDFGGINIGKARKAGKMHLVKKYRYTSTDKTEQSEIELYDAQSALKDIIDRLQGKAIQRKEISGKDGQAIRIITTGENLDDL